jgi:hypothetical protein
MRGRAGIFPLILNLGARWIWSVSGHFQGKLQLTVDWIARRASELVWNVQRRKCSAPAE